jgi:hypothetical protein
LKLFGDENFDRHIVDHAEMLYEINKHQYEILHTMFSALAKKSSCNCVPAAVNSFLSNNASAGRILASVKGVLMALNDGIEKGSSPLRDLSLRILANVGSFVEDPRQCGIFC